MSKHMKPSEWIDARAEFIFKNSPLATGSKFCHPGQFRDLAIVDYLNALKPMPEVSHGPEEGPGVWPAADRPESAAK